VLVMPRSDVLTTDIDDVGSGRRRRLVCGQEDVSTMEDDVPATIRTALYVALKPVPEPLLSV